ncbi:transketolase [bacterium]|nr:transketolase [bacterium]
MKQQNEPFRFDEVDELAVNSIRILSAEMVERANSGHPGMPMGFAMIAHILWSRFLRYNPDDPFWNGRDRFILSAGHGSALQYCLLHIAGYNLPMEELKNFRQLDSRTPGHPENFLTAGVETTTGPLGQGIANAVGMAVGQRYVREQLGLHDTNGFDPLDHTIFVVASDGDMQEGISSEAASFAGHQKLGSLVVLYDDNQISIDGSTSLAWSEDVGKRFEAYGWHILRADGLNPEEIYQSIHDAVNEKNRPTLVLCKTIIGYGSPNKSDKSAAHGAPLGEEELELARKQLGWEYPPFTVPDEVYVHYARNADEGRQAQEQWQRSLDEWLQNHPERIKLWVQLMMGRLPEKWDERLTYDPKGEAMATRSASGKALNAIAPALRPLLGGCADLAGSVKTMMKDQGDFQPESPGGRNLYFGIREHAMGAIANGMAMYGSLRPYTGTFLIFSDYMRPPIRLAALMRLPVIFLFSHDSFGVGEDGPTHQPVEHYAALRSIPGLYVFRPADVAEMFEAWRFAILKEDAPVGILSTRQKLDAIDRTIYAPGKETWKGGYVLAETNNTPSPKVILIATGSEVTLAMRAFEVLKEKGIGVRVVSLPCWELFEEQDQSYRDEVLPPHIKARVGIESGITQGWERYIGDEGVMLGLNHFGASAPGNVLAKEFGFTVENVIEHVGLVLK